MTCEGMKIIIWDNNIAGECSVKMNVLQLESCLTASSVGLYNAGMVKYMKFIVG
jgi:hypothetical protein